MKTKERYVCEITPVYKSIRGLRKSRLNDSFKAESFIRKIFPAEWMNHFECFGVVFLDSNLNVIGYKIISVGGIGHAVVDLRLLFQACLLCNAVGIITFHNHPSGSLRPSHYDLDISQKIYNAGQLLQINLVENLIIT